MDDRAEFLVVVDMQNDFVNGSLGSDAAKAIVPNVAGFLAKFLDEHGKARVIFTKDTHGQNYLETSEGRHLPVTHCVIGTEGWNIVPELGQLIFSYTKQHLEDRSNVTVVEKPTFGSVNLPEIMTEMGACLQSSGADDRLDGSGVTIHIMGLCTDICVVSNALLLKAYFPEARVVLHKSCCAGTSKEAQEAALATMKMCQIEIEE